MCVLVCAVPGLGAGLCRSGGSRGRPCVTHWTQIPLLFINFHCRSKVCTLKVSRAYWPVYMVKMQFIKMF